MADSDGRAIEPLNSLRNLDLVNWCVLLPVGPEATVLEVSGGPGALTFGLASLYRRVITLEGADARRAAGAEGPRNIWAVQAEPGQLPVAAGSVDLGLLVGALPGRPGDQLCILRELWRVLRPGGVLYLGSENRWARRAATIGGRLRGRSAWGYRRLLAEAGFSDIRVWCAVPSHEEPRYLVPLEQRAFGHFLRVLAGPAATPMRRLATRALHEIGLLKHLVPSFALVARRGTATNAG